MKNKELVKELATRLKWTSADVSEMLAQLGTLVGSHLVESDTIQLGDFGQLEARKKGERISVNPANGKRYLIPPKLVPVFKPSTAIKTKLKEISSNE